MSSNAVIAIFEQMSGFQIFMEFMTLQETPTLFFVISYNSYIGDAGIFEVYLKYEWGQNSKFGASKHESVLLFFLLL